MGESEIISEDTDSTNVDAKVLFPEDDTEITTQMFKTSTDETKKNEECSLIGQFHEVNEGESMKSEPLILPDPSVDIVSEEEPSIKEPETTRTSLSSQEIHAAAH